MYYERTLLHSSICAASVIDSLYTGSSASISADGDRQRTGPHSQPISAARPAPPSTPHRTTARGGQRTRCLVQDALRFLGPPQSHQRLANLHLRFRLGGHGHFRPASPLPERAPLGNKGTDGGYLAGGVGVTLIRLSETLESLSAPRDVSPGPRTRERSQEKLDRTVLACMHPCGGQRGCDVQRPFRMKHRAWRRTQA